MFCVFESSKLCPFLSNLSILRCLFYLSLSIKQLLSSSHSTFSKAETSPMQSSTPRNFSSQVVKATGRCWFGCFGVKDFLTLLSFHMRVLFSFLKKEEKWCSFRRLFFLLFVVIFIKTLLTTGCKLSHNLFGIRRIFFWNAHVQIWGIQILTLRLILRQHQSMEVTLACSCS